MPIGCNGFIYPMGSPPLLYDSNPGFYHTSMYPSNASLGYGYDSAHFVKPNMQVPMHKHDRVVIILQALSQIHKKD